ncbi:MAG TPA: dienelactone hydrolase family protein [Candidatus Polarisedimenticolia bacterium]|nr:dienelactone hydrolase family protein [Candidatus Polarisedimenticolia bacterium]
MPVCRATVPATRPSQPSGFVLFAALVAASAGAATAGPIEEGRIITFKVRNEDVQGYLVRPEKSGSAPGIVVIHEWWGLNDQIKHVADRLAEDGYMAIAPDLFRGKQGTDAGLAHDLMRGLNEAWAVDVVTGAVAQLRAIEVRERRGPVTGRMPVGTIGFSMGGRISLATALAGADVQAAVMYYGNVETDKAALAPLAVPLLGIYGNEDRDIPLEQVRAFQTALKEAGKDATVLVYPGVGRAFFNEERPSYDAEAAKDSWERTRMFLKKNLTPEAAGAAPPARRPHPELP